MYRGNFIIFLFLWLIFWGCLPTPKSQRLHKSPSEDNLSLTDLSFSSNESFIHDRGKNFFQTFYLAPQSSFIQPIKLKGKNIHNFLSIEENRSQQVCLVAHFPQGSKHQLLIIPLFARKEINLERKTLEYYYLIQHINSTSLCTSAELLAQLQKDFPSKSSTFQFQEICPSCTQSIRSEGLRAYFNNSGDDLSLALKLPPLAFQFLTLPLLLL